MRKIPYDIVALNRIRPGGRADAAHIRDSAARGVDIDKDTSPERELTNVERAMLKAVRRQGLFQTIPFTVGAVPLLVRQSEPRTYFMVHNTGSNTLFVGFDTIPNAITGLGIAAGGFGEPFQVPSNDIWIVSNAIGTTGILIVCVEN